MSRGFLRTLDGIESVLNLICSFVLFLLMFYVTLEVIMRFFFNSPLSGHLEMSQLLIAAAVFLGLSYAQARRSHVGMDILINRLPIVPAMIVDTLTLFLSLIAWAIIVYFSWEQTVNSFQIGDATPTAGFSSWWSKAAIPVGGGLLCLRFVIQILENIYRLIKGQYVHPASLAHHEEIE